MVLKFGFSFGVVAVGGRKNRSPGPPKGSEGTGGGGGGKEEEGGGSGNHHVPGSGSELEPMRVKESTAANLGTRIRD